MPPYQVQIAPRAQSQIDEVSAWWTVNRPAASTLVADELAAEFDTTPTTRSKNPGGS